MEERSNPLADLHATLQKVQHSVVCFDLEQLEQSTAEARNLCATFTREAFASAPAPFVRELRQLLRTAQSLLHSASRSVEIELNLRRSALEHLEPASASAKSV